MVLETDYQESLKVTPMSHDKLSVDVVYDEKCHWLCLIEAVTIYEPVSP